MRTCTWLALVAAVALAGIQAAQAEGTRIGGGAHYWQTIDDLDGEFDDAGLSPVLTIQQRLGDIFSIQGDLEFFPDGYAGALEDVIAPQAFVLVGAGLYGGLGIGTLYADGNFSDNPFFILRAGIDLELLPRVHVDVNANYHFAEWDGINEVDERLDSDTITLGAAVRVDL
jgi:hypothetical protein